MKKRRTVCRTAATYGMNSRFFLRFWKTQIAEKKLRMSAQKSSGVSIAQAKRAGASSAARPTAP